MRKIIIIATLMNSWIANFICNGQNTTDDIKIFNFEFSGHLGAGRAADYLPCYEPFYLKIKTDQTTDRTITSAKVWFFDEDENGSIKSKVKNEEKIAIVTKGIVVNENFYSIKNANGTKTYTSREFNSVASTKNELLIYVDATLNYKRYTDMNYEFTYYDEEKKTFESSATAIIDKKKKLLKLISLLIAELMILDQKNFPVPLRL